MFLVVEATEMGLFAAVFALFAVKVAALAPILDHKLRSNESEVLTIASLQSPSMPHLKAVYNDMVTNSHQFRLLDGLFQQQNQVYPADGEQLPNFGANIPWKDILGMVQNNVSRRLIVMVRHGQAWENLNPDGNDKCTFMLNGEVIQNFDSALSTEGVEQAKNLNVLFGSDSGKGSGLKWFDELGLATADYYSSPLMRTMQTADFVFSDLKTSDTPFIVTDMMRAVIGQDVCNYRHSVHSPTSESQLPGPWNSTCDLPKESLTDLFASSKVKFEFNVRPQGGEGIGLVGDHDTLWRRDVFDDTRVLRARILLAQLFEHSTNPVICIVTHGEMIDAMYQAGGVTAGYPKPPNIEVVPMVVEIL